MSESASQTDVAIIIGGTTGLGRQLAIKCLAHSVVPIIFGRQAHKALVDDPAIDGAILFTFDLANPREYMPTLPVLETCIGNNRLTHLFWVAGRPQGTPFFEMKLEDIVTQIDVNMKGPALVLQTICKMLIVWQRPIHLVTICSTAAYKPRIGEELYCAAQAFRAKLSREWASALSRYLPGSLSTLFLLDGMDTSFSNGSNGGKVGTSVTLMNPAGIAEIIIKQTGLGHGSFYRPLHHDESVPTTPYKKFIIEPTYDGLPEVLTPTLGEFDSF